MQKNALKPGKRTARHLTLGLFALSLTGLTVLAMFALPHRPRPLTGDPRGGQTRAGNPSPRTLPGEPNAFTFVVLSDRTGGHAPGKWEEAVEHVNRLAPDFVMTVGDFVEGYTNDEAELLRQWDEFDAIAARLKPPIYFCPGNHDAASDDGRRVYIERHGTGGRTSYSFDGYGCHFVVIDATTLPGREHKDLAAETLAWLAADLATAAARQARHVFVFAHYPLYGEPSWPRIKQMLDPSRTTIFGGHWHAAGHSVAQGFECYVLPATGTHWPGYEFPAEGKFNAFARVTVPAGTADEPVRRKIELIPVGQTDPVPFPEIELPADYFTTATVSPQG